jgi:hypothetical protein
MTEEIVLMRGRLPRVGLNKALLLVSETRGRENSWSKPVRLSVTVLCTECGLVRSVTARELFDATCECCERGEREKV